MDKTRLNKQTSIEDFRRIYWLREELQAFCREEALSTAGSKQELAQRIETYLITGSRPVVKSQPEILKTKEPMPRQFYPEMVIGPGWRCSQDLRAFFEQELGARFHFDGVMRDFIKNGVGKTLKEAMQAWEAGQQQPKGSKEIGPQFEYNRHIRAYFEDHPGATLKEAIQAWEIKKAKRADGE
jgi:hypothetical protein